MGPAGWTGDHELLRLELAGTYGGTKFIQYADDITYDWGLKLEDTNGNNRLTISHDTGNVGLGTVNPLEKLHVAGRAIVDSSMGVGTSSSDAALHVSSTADKKLFRVDDAGAGDGTPFVIDQDGNVGVNFQSYVEPQTKLHVMGPAGWTGDNELLRLELAGTYGGTKFIQYADDISYDWGLKLQDTNGNDRLTINHNTGNVGLGTRDPDAALHVSSAVVKRLFRVDDDGVGDGTPFVIDQDGNVGVNFQSYTDPQTRLHVMGPAGWTGDNELLRLELAGTFGGTKFIQYADDITYDWGLKLEDTNGNNRLTINHNTGNVGLGTPNPAEKLHVAGNTIVDSSMGVGTSGLDAKLHVSSSTAGRLFRVDDAGEGDGTPFVIDQDGNVGVNFQSYVEPQTRFHVMGPAGWTGDNELMRLELAGLYGGTKFIQYADDITYDWGLKLEDTNGNNRLTISYNTGNVGIGTTSPQRLLHLVGANPRILIEASSVSPEVNFKNSGDTGSETWALYKHGGNDDFRFYQGGDKVTIQDSTGNVGIGTTSPTRKLHVNDVMRLEPRATAPSSPSPGDMYIDSSDSNKLKVWDGSLWQACW
jgi:hypothetical protein